MAPRVDFYLIDSPQPRSKLLIACRLAAKAHASNMTVYVQVDDQEIAQQLDELMWTYTQNSFLPHGLADGSAKVEEFPVQIGVSATPPQDCRDMLISLASQAGPESLGFQRVAQLVGGDEQDKLTGREKFRFYRQQGIDPGAHPISL